MGGGSILRKLQTYLPTGIIPTKLIHVLDGSELKKGKSYFKHLKTFEIETYQVFLGNPISEQYLRIIV